MNVLSLFDGMSCGRMALDTALVPYKTYFASEIEQSAIEVTQKNYPDTVQLGDVTQVFAKDLPKIDLLLGGSPCQGFSFAGKQLNFDDPRSSLFYEYIRLLEDCSPQYFLLENVRMKKDHAKVITDYLGVEPHFINSASFTAHDRKRLYWTNIRFPKVDAVQTPTLASVLDETPDPSLFLRPEIAARYEPTQNYRLDPSKSCVIGKLSKYQGDRVFDVNGKASSLSASGGNNGAGGCNIVHDPSTGKLRKLSVSECARLQGVSPSYLKGFSPTKMYHALGNGWTVDVIAHIFSGLN